MGTMYSRNKLETEQKRMSRREEVASEEGGKSREEHDSVKRSQMLMRSLVR